MRGAINGYVLVRSRAALLMFAAPQPVSPARKMAQCRVDLRRCHGLGYHRRLAWRLQRIGDGLALDRQTDRITATFRPYLARKRSEKHTSELQSPMRNSYAVFCLKNKNISYK